MAKSTSAIIHQELALENKGIEVNVWDGKYKGGKLVVTKATVSWFAPKSKRPTWSGTWEELAERLAGHICNCDYCGKENMVAKHQRRHTCIACGRRFEIEW